MNTAVSTSALRSRIIAGTNAATVSAVVEVCVRINLTSVCVIQITIVKRGCTCGDFTGAVDASWSSIGDATSVAAGITVVDIVAAVDFASVAVIQVTILPRRGTRRDLAVSSPANRGTIGDLTLDTASSAIASIDVEVYLAPVTIGIITIIEA